MEERHPVSTRQLEAPVEIPEQSDVSAVAVVQQPRVVVARQQPRRVRVWFGRVVDDDHLVFHDRTVLGQRGVERLLQDGRAIEGRDRDGEAWARYGSRVSLYQG